MDDLAQQQADALRLQRENMALQPGGLPPILPPVATPIPQPHVVPPPPSVGTSITPLPVAPPISPIYPAPPPPSPEPPVGLPISQPVVNRSEFIENRDLEELLMVDERRRIEREEIERDSIRRNKGVRSPDSGTGVGYGPNVPPPSPVSSPPVGPPPEVSLGEIKGEDSYSKGLRQLASRGHVSGNTALVTYDRTGSVHMQVFGKGPAGTRQILWEGNIGRVPQLPQEPPGTTGFGNSMEPLVRTLVEQATGQAFKSKEGWRPGPDLLPT